MTIYLYKKTHNKTGLKYLGKTIQDPYTYRGSGKRWLNHIKTHGNDVSTEILRECVDEIELIKWGKYYSELWNVVTDQQWANLMPEMGDGGTTMMGDSHYTKRPGYVNKLAGQAHPMKRPENKAKISGPKHFRYDPTVYTFYHKSGIVEECTTLELRNKYGIGVAIRQVILGKAKSYKGWRITPDISRHGLAGKTLSQEHKQSLREAKIGKTLTDEHKKKISASLKRTKTDNP